MPILHRLHDRLTADPSRVVVRPFHLAWQATGASPSRSQKLVAEILDMSETAVQRSLKAVLHDFEQRHWQTRRVFQTRFEELVRQLKLDVKGLSEARRELIGAYFCHEYSYAAAALMNPSITLHPDQTGLDKGTVRFVMSLRAVGEGHISSIAFREGLLGEDGSFYLSTEPPFATAATSHSDQDTEVLGTVEVTRDEDSRLSGTVIFPVTSAQANGLEDLRLTHFVDDDGSEEWIGTYTAYSGREIRSELMRTTDFRSFRLQPMIGPAAANKGMALFPRRIDGRYVMIGRQDGQNLFLLKSDKVDSWAEGVRIMEPTFPWEFIQIGNCGPPIELDEGWLLLTHGVGAMRKYSIGAALLDKKDPSKVLARSTEPLITPAHHDREGYVPNVVYTCGALKLGTKIFIPYGIADSSVAFAFVEIDQLLATME